MGQTAYTERLLAKMGMNDCNQVKTPADPGNHLVKADEDEPAPNQQLYRSAVGSLMYLATSTRPDISFAVGTLARFSSKPNKSHWIALKRVLRYLKGTAGYGITFRGDGSGECTCFSDADWARNKDDRRSTSGYLFKIAGGPVTWRSKRQDTVALSTAEAEYLALSSTTQEVMWMRRLNSELGNSQQGPTIIQEDNQSAISMSKNPQFHGRAKHIDIRHHFIREQVHNGVIELKYCPTQEMLADMFTKGLAQERFCLLRDKIGNGPLET